MSTPPDQNPGCLGAILRLLGVGTPPASPADAFPYRLRDDYLSPAELSFYRALSQAVEARAVICPKVGLSNVFFVVRPHENHAARNRISQKHVDFLLCEPATMKPLLGVELDDSSHARPDRRARDEFVDRVFAAAQLPLLHVPVQRVYDPQDLAARVAPLLAPAPPAAAPPAPVDTDSTPLCPKCGVPMVVRTATRGERRGQPFFGCPNYPRCRETRPTAKAEG